MSLKTGVQTEKNQAGIRETRQGVSLCGAESHYKGRGERIVETKQKEVVEKKAMEIIW